jgi:mono/diheme cytochrome c family protein
VPGVKETPPSPDIGINQPPRSAPPGPPPEFGNPVTSPRPVKPIIGGTLLVLDDARTAIASDPDRGRVYVADYRAQKKLAEFELQPTDEPGRLVADGDGQVHVALRGGGAVLTLAPNPWRIAGRRDVCTAPRGLAYDADQRQIHVACAEGELVSLPIAADGAAVRRLVLDRDLRDVVVDGDSLLVSKFRSAEVLTIDRAGAVVGRRVPGSRRTIRPVNNFNNGSGSSGGSAEAPSGGDFTGGGDGNALMTASVAWKMIPVRNGEALLLHQRGLADEVSETQGGYSGQGCGGIVETTISRVGLLGDDGPRPSLPAGPVAVDMALSPDGNHVAVVSPGLARTKGNGRFPFSGQQVVELDYGFVQQTAGVCDGPNGGGSKGGPIPTGGAAGSEGTGGAGGSPGDGGVGDAGPGDEELPPPVIDYRQPDGEAVSIAYDRRGHILVQTREPASIQVLTAQRVVALSYDQRADTGHAIFHSDSGGGIACASCHPEGGDDGRTWKFRNKQGVLEIRRTQNLRGGVMGTAPFHWNGDLKGMGDLMSEVFVNRMQGPALDTKYVETLSHWIDTIPALPALPVSNGDAVTRGKSLYMAAGCATCHNGALFTDNTSRDVGTGRALQVPSLRGVGWRAPYMHDGCATTLTERFNGKCGGGDKHGVTSKFSPAQIADLVAFVETL